MATIIYNSNNHLLSHSNFTVYAGPHNTTHLWRLSPYRTISQIVDLQQTDWHRRDFPIHTVDDL